MGHRGYFATRGMRPVGARLSVLFILAAALLAWIPRVQAQELWLYRGAITGLGTRSEGFLGDLFFAGHEIPPKFGRIATPIGTYQFKPPSGTPWIPGGWLRVGPTPASKVSMTINPPRVHWYQGPRRRNTPPSWVYLPGDKYWVDPAYLEQFAKAELAGVAAPAAAPLARLLSATTPQVGDRNTGVFVYKQFIAAAGSRSAGLRGTLLYNGQPLRSVGTLKTPIGTFYFTQGGYPWDDLGWFPTSDVVVKDTAAPFTAADRKRGSYTGPKKALTPSDWCYSPERDTWFAPARLR